MGGEFRQQRSDTPPDAFDGSFLRLAQPSLELCEHLLNRVQIRRVGWQEDEVCSCRTDGRANPLALVTSEIVDDDDVAGFERWDKHLLEEFQFCV